MTEVVHVKEPFLLFSDIHGNLPALELALAFSKDRGIEKFVSLGDHVDYNPYGDEVVEKVMTHPGLLAVIQGNHEDFIQEVARNRFYSKFENRTFEPHYIRRLKFQPRQLTLEFPSGRRVLLCHENPHNELADYLRPWDTDIIDSYLRSVREDAFFFGHTHIITHHILEYGKEVKAVFNPGSLGQARQGADYLSFAHVYPDEEMIALAKIKIVHGRDLDLVSDAMYSGERIGLWKRSALDYVQD